MIKKYRKPQMRIKKHEIFDEIANVDILSTLIGDLGDIVGDDEEENEEWVG